MLKGGDAHVLTFQGEAKRLEQDLEGALKDLGEAHELQPKLVYILGMRAIVKQQLGGNLLKEPLVDYTMVMDAYPAQSNYLYERGIVHAKLGAYADALKDLNRAFAMAPRSVEFSVNELR